VGEAVATAIEKSGIKHAVVLSSVGADKPDKTGPVVGLYNFEKKVSAIPSLNALYLRPAGFMENLLFQIGVIKGFGTMAGPVKGDLRLPMIATRDIGDAAADALLQLNFQGKSAHELQGARDVTNADACGTVEARFHANGHVFEYGGSAVGIGGRAEFGTLKSAGATLGKEHHSHNVGNFCS
jgi:hypothetical protein